jgi:hypothetical protein
MLCFLHPMNMLITFFQSLICLIIKNFPSFMYLKDVQSLVLDFKFYIIQRLNIFVKLIAC